MPKQTGFTLVEIMISILLGSLIIISISSLYMTTNKSMWLTDALSQNQENGRFSLEMLSHHIRFAGFNPGTGQTPQAILKNDCGKIFCSQDNINGSDELVISFMAPEGYRNCAGGTVNKGDFIISRFWVEDNTLRCSVSMDNGESVFDSAALLDNVQSMQILAGSQNQFLHLDDANLKVGDVKTIRIALLLTSGEVSQNNKPAVEEKKRSYALLDEKIGDFQDRSLRQVFSTSIYLVNNL